MSQTEALKKKRRRTNSAPGCPKGLMNHWRIKPSTNEITLIQPSNFQNPGSSVQTFSTAVTTTIISSKTSSDFVDPPPSSSPLHSASGPHEASQASPTVVSFNNSGPADFQASSLEPKFASTMYISPSHPPHPQVPSALSQTSSFRVDQDVGGPKKVQQWNFLNSTSDNFQQTQSRTPMSSLAPPRPLSPSPSPSPSLAPSPNTLGQSPSPSPSPPPPQMISSLPSHFPSAAHYSSPYPQPNFYDFRQVRSSSTPPLIDPNQRQTQLQPHNPPAQPQAPTQQQQQFQFHTQPQQQQQQYHQQQQQHHLHHLQPQKSIHSHGHGHKDTQIPLQSVLSVQTSTLTKRPAKTHRPKAVSFHDGNNEWYSSHKQTPLQPISQTVQVPQHQSWSPLHHSPVSSNPGSPSSLHNSNPPSPSNSNGNGNNISFLRSSGSSSCSLPETNDASYHSSQSPQSSPSSSSSPSHQPAPFSSSPLSHSPSQTDPSFIQSNISTPQYPGHGNGGGAGGGGGGIGPSPLSLVKTPPSKRLRTTSLPVSVPLPTFSHFMRNITSPSSAAPSSDLPPLMNDHHHLAGTSMVDDDPSDGPFDRLLPPISSSLSPSDPQPQPQQGQGGQQGFSGSSETRRRSYGDWRRNIPMRPEEVKSALDTGVGFGPEPRSMLSNSFDHKTMASGSCPSPPPASSGSFSTSSMSSSLASPSFRQQVATPSWSECPITLITDQGGSKMDIANLVSLPPLTTVPVSPK